MRLITKTLLTVFLISFFPLAVRADINQATCAGLAAIEWHEAQTQSFAILYPSAHADFGRALFEIYGEMLDAEYARFESLFKASLPLPISIRIYPTEIHYDCLNAQAPKLPPGALHSHIGTREIALIGENIAANPSAWQTNYQNAFRYEQGALFTEQVTDQKAPPGLITAVGHFAQDPFQTIGALRLSRSDWQQPTYTWSGLWEEAGSASDLARRLQTTSTVAFLIDIYGWNSFLKFLGDLRTSESYRAALAQVYQMDYGKLQEQWQQYYPGYFSGRWQAHILYNYDLSAYQEMLSAGEYSSAQKSLQEVVQFLEMVDQTDALQRARRMLDMAGIGLDAETLVVQARQALYAGQYQHSLDLVDQAQARFGQLGSSYRMDELNAYRDQLGQIHGLHQELERLRGQIFANQGGFFLVTRLISLGQRLGELGDAQGERQVRELAQVMEGRQRQLHHLLSIFGFIAVLMLLGLRFWLASRRPPPEAQL